MTTRPYFTLKRGGKSKKIYYKKKGYKGKAMRRAKAALHAPKKFVMEFKVMDVISAAPGTNVGGYSRNILTTTWSSLPLASQLTSLYKQYALTGVQYKYRATNTNPSVNSYQATQLLFVEDKDSTNALTIDQALSQDNVRNLRTNRNFKHYIRYPRPELYQQDSAGHPVLTIQSAKQLQWFDAGVDIRHLGAQMLIQDQALPSTEAVKEGELWAKVYVVMKEQCKN